MSRIITVAKILAFLILILSVFVQKVYGVTTPPDFPSCVNPQGSIKASYSTGTHGVAGVVTTYKGADTVYAVSNDILIQCLCPENGEGIQTNWWKIPQMSVDEIETFKKQGWVYIPDGSAWGLDPTEFLAKNSEFSCRSSNSSSTNSSVGGVSSLGEILALAATGNIKTIYILVFIGLLSMTFGYLLNKRNN